MRTIVHLSDLHFGRTNEKLITPLLNIVESFLPDLIVISGDLTMRATKKEFLEAQAFLNKLPHPKIIVPGNHDIPLYNVYSRFFRALEKYQHFITSDLSPAFQDEEMAIYGLNTARSWKVMHGQIDEMEIEKICEKLRNLPNNILKIIVSHHPLDLPLRRKRMYIAKRSKLALKKLIEAKADLFLAGHVHASIITHTPDICASLGYNSLIIQAGTATSFRTRHEENAFNILQFNYPLLEIRTFSWDMKEGNFRQKNLFRVEHSGQGWQ